MSKLTVEVPDKVYCWYGKGKGYCKSYLSESNRCFWFSEYLPPNINIGSPVVYKCKKCLIQSMIFPMLTSGKVYTIDKEGLDILLDALSGAEGLGCAAGEKNLSISPTRDGKFFVSMRENNFEMLGEGE